ncbi:hypothetical protein [Streptosporangium carneum]|uniref:Uncharacterized protein n=1 Tax=Streptosporangium carneum TaxID=47481 RepID=A0A9W6HXE3_9ACTN|nr:hypothetical protein [Streptosporangium carneum]GLK07424.1 hypothetical protein GCM10017600_08290 [Streptosporangium carneum]
MSDTARAIRRVYLACEFLPADPTVRGLVSIGLTDDAGRDYYAVNNDMDFTAVLDVPWMVDDVWPWLPRCTADGYPYLLDRVHPDVKLIKEIRDEVAMYFACGPPETHLYAACGGQHIHRLHSLWDNHWEVMPSAVPRWFHELWSLAVQAGNPPLPERPRREHHALTHARYYRTLHERLLTLTACPRCGGDGFRPARGFHRTPAGRQWAAPPRIGCVDESPATRRVPEDHGYPPYRPDTGSDRSTRLPTRQMHSVVCDVCAYVYDEDGDGILVFVDPEEAVRDVLRHHWMCLTDGRAICPRDDEEHRAVYDELMPPEPGAGGDERIPPDEEIDERIPPDEEIDERIPPDEER